MNHSHGLVNVRTLFPSIICDIRYATVNNFTANKLYPFDACFIHKELIEPLKNIVQLLEQQSLRLKIFDAYRPQTYQFILWEHCPDERYVGNPHQGSRHNQGMALDCTLTNTEGNELEMGTGYDDFSQKAHRNYSDLPQLVLNNRKLLEDIFQENGFIGLPSEWWHFDYHAWNKFPFLSVPFEELSI